MSKPRLKYLPSVYIAKEPGESARDLVERVLKDPRLLPDQRLSLEMDKSTAFDDLVRGIWLEQAPIAVSAGDSRE